MRPKVAVPLVFTFFQKKGRVGMIKKGTFVRQKGTLVRKRALFDR